VYSCKKEKLKNKRKIKMSERITVTEVDTTAENDEFIRGMMEKIHQRREDAKTGSVEAYGAAYVEKDGRSMPEDEFSRMLNEGQDTAIGRSD
jgi:hypothetical protein